MGNPIPQIIWLDNHGNDISLTSTENTTRKFEVTQQGSLNSLKIRRPTIQDVGNYTLVANNGKMQKKEEYELIVTSKFRLQTNILLILRK